MSIKRYLDRYSSYHFIFYSLLVLVLVLSGSIVTNTILTTRELSRIHWTTSVDMIEQRLNSIIGEINSFPRTASNDLVFLSGLSSMKDTDLNHLEKDFLAFLLENTAYYQLVYIDQSGQVQMLVEFDGQNYSATRDISKDFYNSQRIENTDRLQRGEVYISPIKVVNINGEETPIITYATPVYTDDLVKKGLIVGSVYADYFLDDIRASQREGEIVFLIDNQGNYLAHPDRSREFAYLFGQDGSFQKDYPEIASSILLNPDKRMIKSKDNIFSMRAIYPTKGSFALYRGAEKTSNNEKQNYSWIIISVTDKKNIEQQSSDLFKQNAIFLFFLFVILTATYGLVWYLVKKGNPE